VGDIDRGGVFAQLFGTVELLERDEKALVKGLIINKFRGDKSILRSGLDQIEGICHKKVLGVVPYTHLDLDDEDSLSARIETRNSVGLVDIAVIRFPHISNFTDFAPLENVDGISLRYVSNVRDFQKPDVVILAGTKNTLADLAWLRQSGLETLIKKHASNGNLVIGICGGYQMLGGKIRDEFNVEHGGTLIGLELLNHTTTLNDEKITTKTTSKTCNISGDFAKLSNVEVTGYEIHCGVTEHDEKALFGNSALGCYKGNVMGTYLHGIFENDKFRKIFIDLLFERKGISQQSVGILDYQQYKETQYDLLADVIRNNLNMDMVYSILEGGV
jgi:adenosylcobyric acid synthase